MRKPLPANIEVGPVAFDVVPTSGNPSAQAAIQAHDARGLCVTETATIMVDEALHPSALRVTLLHETLHALTHHAGLAGELNGHNDRLEEFVVQALAAPLLDTLRRNPALVAFLLDQS